MTRNSEQRTRSSNSLGGWTGFQSHALAPAGTPSCTQKSKYCIRKAQTPIENTSRAVVRRRLTLFCRGKKWAKHRGRTCRQRLSPLPAPAEPAFPFEVSFIEQEDSDNWVFSGGKAVCDDGVRRSLRSRDRTTSPTSTQRVSFHPSCFVGNTKQQKTTSSVFASM